MGVKYVNGKAVYTVDKGIDLSHKAKIDKSRIQNSKSRTKALTKEYEKSRKNYKGKEKKRTLPKVKNNSIAGEAAKNAREYRKKNPAKKTEKKKNKAREYSKKIKDQKLTSNEKLLMQNLIRTGSPDVVKKGLKNAEKTLTTSKAKTKEYKNLNKRVAKQDEKFLNSSPAAYGFMAGSSPIPLKETIEHHTGRKINTKKAEKTIGYKAGYMGGIMAEYALTGGAARASVQKGIETGAKQLAKKSTKKAVVNVVKKGEKLPKAVKRISSGVAADTITGLPTNALEAGKESVNAAKGEKKKAFAKSLALNTALDVGFGGAMEALPAAVKGAKAAKASRSSYIPADTVPRKSRKVYKEYIRSNDKGVIKFAEKAQSGKVSKKASYKLSDVTADEAEKLKKLTGIDTTGYTHNLKANTINEHIMKRHGKEGVADSSMADMNDLSRINYIIKNADDVELVRNADGTLDLSREILNADGSKAIKIKYTKKIDGHYYVVEAVPDSGKKKVQVVTAYIDKSDMKKAAHQVADTENSPLHTSEVALDITAKDSISQAKNSVNADLDMKKAADQLVDGKMPPSFHAQDAVGMTADNSIPKAEAGVKNIPESMPDARKFMSPETQERVFDAVSKRSGAKIEFADLPEGVDGVYKNGVIKISNNAQNPAYTVMKHELTHHIETSGHYKAFADFVENNIRNQGVDVDGMIDSIISDYKAIGKDLTKEEARKEFTAKFAEECLFNSEKSIERLARDNPSLFRQVYEWIVDTIHRIGASPETRFLIDAQRKYEKALKTATASADDVEKYLFVGAEKNKIAMAERMEADGASPEEIKRKLNMHREADGKWRFETDDSKASFYPNGDARFAGDAEYQRYRELTDKAEKNMLGLSTEELTAVEKAERAALAKKYANLPKGSTLGDYMTHPELYNKYPDMEEIPFGRVTNLPENTKGAYSPKHNSIVVNSRLKGNDFKSTIIHETQHAIQEIENFARGSNLKALDKELDSIKHELKSKERAYDSVSDRIIELMDNTGYFEKYGDDIDISSIAEQKRIKQAYKGTPEEKSMLQLLERMSGIQHDMDALRIRTGKLNKTSSVNYYLDSAGESEARQAEKRLTMNEEQRKETMPEKGVNVNVAGDIDVSNSLREFSDGKRFVNIDVDTSEFDGLSRREQGQRAVKIIKDNFAGKVVGTDNPIFVNGRGASEFGFPLKKLDDAEHSAKMKSAAELDNMFDAGDGFRNMPDGADGHIHQDVVGGFDYYDVIFKVGDRYYKGVINIKNTNKGRLFKDITKIKDVTEDISSSYGKNPKSTFLRTSSNNSIPESLPRVKGGKEVLSAGSRLKDDTGVLDSLRKVSENLYGEKGNRYLPDARNINIVEADNALPAVESADMGSRFAKNTGEREPIENVFEGKASIDEEWKALEASQDDDKRWQTFINDFAETSEYDTKTTGMGLAQTAENISNKGVSRGKDIQRNADAAFAHDPAGRQAFKRNVEDPLYMSKGRYAKAVQGKTDDLYNYAVKGLGIKKGSKESAAVQWYGEGFKVEKVDGEFKEVPYTLDNLKKDYSYTAKNGRPAWENIVEAEKYARRLYDEYFDRLQKTLIEIYPDVEKNVEKLEKKLADLKSGTRVKRIEKRIADAKAKGQTDEELQDVYEALERAKDEMSEAGVKKIEREIFDAKNNKRLYKRNDYFRHFKDLQNGFFKDLSDIMNSSTDIDPRLLNLSEFTQPKSKWTGFLQKREGALGYKADAIGGLLEYIPQAEYKINIEPNISNLRNAIKELQLATYKSKNANKFIDELVQVANDLAGKTNKIDRIPGMLLGDKKGRQLINGLTKVSNRIRASAVVGNFNTVLAQFFNMPNVVAYAKNPADVVSGMSTSLRAVMGDKNAKEILDKSMFLKERYLDRSLRRFNTGVLDNVNNFCGWMLEIGDKAVADAAFCTFYKQAKRKGLSELEAVLKADEMTRKSVAGRGIAEMPLSQKAKLTKLLAPFQVEVKNSVNVMTELLGKKDAAGLIALFGVSWMMNEALDVTTGRRIIFDPIEVLKNGYEEYREDGDLGEAAKNTAANMFGEILTNIPGGTYAADIISDTLGISDLQKAKLFGENDPTRYGTGNIALQTLLKPAAQAIQGKNVDLLTPALSLALPFGGKQIQRTISGMQDMGVLPDARLNFNDGINFEFGRNEMPGSYSDSGNLRFAIDPTAANYITAGTLGTWSTKQGKEYLKAGSSPLSDRQTAAAKGAYKAGISGVDAERYVRNIKAIEKSGGKSKLQRQREHIKNMSISANAKNELGKMVDKDKHVDYSSEASYKYSLLNKQQKEKVDELRDKGFTKESALKIRETIKGHSSQMSQVMALAGTGYDTPEVYSALGIKRGKKGNGPREKAEVLMSYGLSIDDFDAVKEASDGNGSGNVSIEEAMKYLDQTDYSREECYALTFAMTGCKHGNNPYR